ncbi:MAG: arylsulfotransferase family protein [Solirubrobacteraceae bacterium]
MSSLPTPSSSDPLSRRAFLGVVGRTAVAGSGAAAALSGCGGGASRPQPHPATRSPPVEAQRFRSRSDLRPPAIHVGTRPPDPKAQSFVFTDCHGGNGQQGPMIIDRGGRLVWFEPVSEHGSTRKRVFNVRVQSYRGEPVLTWWQGSIVGAHGHGHYEILDQTYAGVARVRAGNGYQGDLHEFRLTDRGTALLTSYGRAEGQLPVHSGSGTRRGAYLYGVVQEVDVATGRVLLQWRSDEHVPVEASLHGPPPADPAIPWDYFHVNSIAVDPDDDNLLISGRNVWACYKVHRHTGEVIWSLGGRDSDFQVADGAQFAFQHHVIPHGDGLLTIFDNESGPPSQASQSRGLVLRLDHSSRRATLVREYLHDPPVLSAALGSVQALDTGGAFLGWGDSSYFTEYDAHGAVVLDARLASGVLSYRAFQDAWAGRPAQPPRIAVRRAGADAHVYVSWNGATVHRRWRLLGGLRGNELRELRSVPVRGFETAISVRSAPRWLAVEALDHDDQPLARSASVRA